MLLKNIWYDYVDVWGNIEAQNERIGREVVGMGWDEVLGDETTIRCAVFGDGTMKHAVVWIGQ